MSLEMRIFQARRVRAIDALIRGGLSAEQAEDWCAAWERHAAMRGNDRSGDFWDDGRRWIDAQIRARKTPQSSTARRAG